MRVSATEIPMMTSEQIESLRARAIVAIRNHAPDKAERQKWQRFVLLADTELGKRRKGRSEARGGRSDDQSEPDLARRLDDAHEALFKTRTKREVRERAEQVAREMRGRA